MKPKKEKSEKGEKSEMVSLLTDIVSQVKDINIRLVTLEDKGQKQEAVEVKQAPVAEAFSAPVPQEYREVVDSVLNRYFGIRLLPRADAPMFEFTIVVPDKYSQATDEQKRMVGGDIRPKVLTLADGVNGVRLWAETVFKNFNPEIRGQIVEDRVKP